MVQTGFGKWVVWMAVVAAGVTTLVARAEEHAPVPSGPAPILVTVREIPKPGEEAAHARLEAQYAGVLAAGKGSQYYVGMGAITGAQQTVFLSGYSSLEEMSEVHDYDETMLGEKLSKLDKDHSGTLAGADTAVWRLRPRLSNPDPVNLGKMRFMELIHIHVKLGHSAEFADVIQHVQEGWMKADPDFHYLVYQQTFGEAKDDSYLVVIAVKSLGDLDKHHALVAKYQRGLGEEAQKHMLAFEREGYNSTESNLFVFTPSMSRLPESWTKEDADFWSPKAATAVAAKKVAVAKPAK